MKKYKLYYILLILFYKSIQAQTASIDTIAIDEVNITANRENYFSSSLSTYKIDSFQTHYFGQNSIAEVLQNFTPIQINTNGIGGIVTLSMRGTADDQTSIYWNGLKLNSVTLGTIDVSLIPTNSATTISILTNASSAVLGSGTFGGAILLNDQPAFQKNINIGIRQDFTSFKNYRSNLSVELGNKKVQFTSHSLFQTAKNNFPFYDVYKIDTPLVNNNHNALKQWSTINTLAIKLKKLQQLNFGSFVLQKQHEIPAIMGSYQKSVAQQQDFSVKSFLKYQKVFTNAQFYFRSGYVYDYMQYDDSASLIASNYKTHQWQNSANYRYYFKHAITLDAGIDYIMEYAKTVAYKNKMFRHRGAAFVGAKYTWKNLTVNAAVRQEMVKGKYIRPQFSALLIYQQKHNKFHTSLSYADKFRLPDFNDLYWQPGGNDKLLPEKGFSIEYTFVVHPIKPTSIYNFNFSNTIYYTSIQDNIVWTPVTSGLYSPQNIKKTRHYGLETVLENSIKISQRNRIKFSVNYNLNHAKIVKDAANNALNGNFIRYKPPHTVKAYLVFEDPNFNFGCNFLYVSKRFTDDENIKVFALKPYFLVDMFIAFKGNYKNVNAEFAFKINNLTNTRYESLRSYAQPLRNYTISIILNYKNKQNEQN